MDDEDDGMTMDLSKSHLVPEGPCEFSIKSARIQKGVDTLYGLRDKIQITFVVRRIDGSGELRQWQIRRSFNISSNDKSDLSRLHTQLHLPKPKKNVCCRDYFGIIGKAEVKHVTLEDGDIIAVLENFIR